MMVNISYKITTQKATSWTLVINKLGYTVVDTTECVFGV